MSWYNKFFGKGKGQITPVFAESDCVDKSSIVEISQNMNSKHHSSTKATLASMLNLMEIEMSKENYARVAEICMNILRLEPSVIAQYNLASLYAQGKGVEQDFREAAYWFRQAELGGDEQAGKLCLKCALDFVHQELEERKPEGIYTGMASFIRRVYPETDDLRSEVCRNLYAMAGNHFNKEEYNVAAKLFRVAAEFGGDGYSQNYLAVLYNAGAGVEKNDLAALYWFDKAVDNGAADVAQADRNGILHAYKENLEPTEFYTVMMELSGWCSVGSADVPRDAAKAEFWRMVGESALGRCFVSGRNV